MVSNAILAVEVSSSNKILLLDKFSWQTSESSWLNTDLPEKLTSKLFLLLIELELPSTYEMEVSAGTGLLDWITLSPLKSGVFGLLEPPECLVLGIGDCGTGVGVRCIIIYLSDPGKY